MSALREIAPEADHLLQVQGVNCRPHERTILQDISFPLTGGEVVGLIVPNGAGKSALLKVIARHWSPSGGEIILCGQPITTFRPHQLARLIGQVAQTNTLEAAFSVQDVVLMDRNLHLGWFEMEKPQDQVIAVGAMQVTNTTALAERLIPTLSGGERQRAFLARTLAQEPSILLLDEPISGLDIRHQMDSLALVQRLARKRGLGVLMAIHDLSLAARFCDRLILLCAGTAIADGTPDRVLTPANLACPFEVEAQPYRDPFTHDLKLSILRTGGSG